MKRNIFITLVLLCCGGLVQAVPVTIQITGNVTSTAGAALPDTIYVGESFTGVYTYDNSAPDADPSAQNGLYYFNSPCGISIAVGGYEFKTASNHAGQFEMEIANDLVEQGYTQDVYFVRSDGIVSTPLVGVTMDYISWNLWDATHTALSSAALPLTAPTLTPWQYNTLTICSADWNPYVDGLIVEGTVTQAVVVPEPATVLLIVAGIFLSKRRR